MLGREVGREHRTVFGRDDADLHDVVTQRASAVFEEYLHAEIGILELAEEAVTVRGEAEVAALFETGGAGNSPRAAIQVQVAGVRYTGTSSGNDGIRSTASGASPARCASA